MKMECITISSENVRPSSPTPQHLQTYKLSMLDQIVSPIPVPLVFFFPTAMKNSDDPDSYISQTTQLLKRSLSVVLTRYYPLAGRVNSDGRSIDCSDSGVPFVVVKFTGHKLTDLLRNPDENLPSRLLPCEIAWDAELGPDSGVMLIQVSYFDCGGIAIGAVFWHKVTDATAMGTFLKSWAATARGSREAVCPNYVAQSLFPHMEEMQSGSGTLAAILKTGRSVMRRYVFDASAISSLKTKSGVERPTRVEVVSALIWKCFMAASLANNNSVSLATHAVNLRRRAQPPFPSDCFGNFPGLAVATCYNESEPDLGNLVRKLRDAISKIDGDFVVRMQGLEGLSGYRENLGRTWSEVPEGADLLSISSWCGFGLYGVDFGWGKPLWLSRCDAGRVSESSRFLNVVWMTDTRHGDGMEAWVTLGEKYMAVFDKDEELRALASTDPSPLYSGVIMSNGLP